MKGEQKFIGTNSDALRNHNFRWEQKNENSLHTAQHDSTINLSFYENVKCSFRLIRLWLIRLVVSLQECTSFGACLGFVPYESILDAGEKYNV